MKYFLIIFPFIIALTVKADAYPTNYYETKWEADTVIGSEVIDFSSYPDRSILVWSPKFELSGYKRCIRTSQYYVEGMAGMSLTCIRAEQDHVSRTITVFCDPQAPSEEQDQMDLIGDDMANHVLFTVKCRTKLIQEKHKS